MYHTKTYTKVATLAVGAGDLTFSFTDEKGVQLKCDFVEVGLASGVMTQNIYLDAMLSGVNASQEYFPIQNDANLGTLGFVVDGRSPKCFILSNGDRAVGVRVTRKDVVAANVFIYVNYGVLSPLNTMRSLGQNRGL